MEKSPDQTLVLPDPLLTQDGRCITTAAQWTNERRAAVLELFVAHVHGRAPVGRPAQMSFTVDDNTLMMGGLATRKQVTIAYEGPGGKGAIHLLLFIPTDAIKRGTQSPTFLLICNRDASILDPDRVQRSAFWPAEEIVAQGYAAAAFLNSDVDIDEHDGFKNGVHGIFDPLFPDGKRAEDAWGTIAAWAWGASRVMDYLQTDPDIDPERVAVVGHSRGGKTALWAGAQDERFALVVSNNSGCTGAAISRGKKGESVAMTNDVFPHWFSEKYKQYNDRESELPVDQHELIALIAPRPIYVASASKDGWADPDAEFRGCVAAEPVYALFGKQGVGSETIPPPDVPLQSGTIGYHLRTGEHDLTLYDWEQFMYFADKQWRR